MLPKNDRLYGEREKRLFARSPLLARLYRWWLWTQYEMRFPIFRQKPWLSRVIHDFADKNMREQIADPALREALTPDYPIGGKRILISDDYYQTLTRPNVEVVTSPIERVAADAVLTRDGRSVPADVVVLATGFESTTFLAPMAIEGLDGRMLHDVWRGGAEAYLGISVAGFPNFFMLYGPNTNLGHNSIIFMLECQVGYVIQCIQTIAERNLAYLDLRPEVMRAYNERLQSVLGGTVWAKTDHSWYKRADGRITNNWSGTTIEYWWKTRRPDLDLYRQVARGAVTESAPVARVA